MTLIFPPIYTLSLVVSYEVTNVADIEKADFAISYWLKKLYFLDSFSHSFPKWWSVRVEATDRNDVMESDGMGGEGGWLEGCQAWK